MRVESEELEEIRDELAEAFHGLLTPQDQAPWRPHVTIQNKVEPREARRFSSGCEPAFEPRPLAIAAWRRGAIWAAPGSRSGSYAFRG